MRAVNLAVRFLLELCALTALGYWGATTADRVAGKVLLGGGAVLVAAVAWGLVVSPKATVDAGPVVRVAVEVAVFAAAVAGLWIAGRPVLASALAVVYAGNRLLMTVWRQ